MKRLALFLLLCVVTAFAGRADDALVNASKEAKSKRRKSSSKVITNADVRKSKGTLIDSGVAATPMPPTEPTLAEAHAARQQVKAITDARVATLQKAIELLEKELAAIEQSYYDENDLQKRDTEIVQRFNETKKKLDETKSALAALLPPPPEATTPKP